MHIDAPRIAPVEAPFDAELAARLSRLVPANLSPPALYLTVAHNSKLFATLVDSGLLGPTGLLDLRQIAKPLRESVILRTCVATGNAYEFSLHVQTISAAMGLNPKQIVDVVAETPDPALWSDAQLVAMRLVDALVEKSSVDDSLYEEARTRFDEATLIELSQLVALYVGVKMLVAVARPAHDRYAPALAAEGLAMMEARHVR